MMILNTIRYAFYVGLALFTLWAVAGAFWMMSQADTMELILGVVLLTVIAVLWGSWFEVRQAARRRAREAEQKRAQRTASTRRTVGLSIALLAGVALNSNCATRVDAGYVGVKINYSGTYRGVQDVPIVTGWVFYVPNASTVLQYPTFVHNVVWTHNVAEGNPTNEEITFTNADQMQISTDVSMAYHLDPAKVPAFYLKFRTDDLTTFSNGFFHNVVRDVFNDHAGKYHIEQIMGDNGAFIAEVKKAVQDQVGEYGVILDQFGIIGAPRPPASVVNAINLKLQAQQIAIQKQNEVAQAQADALKEVASAEGHARAVIAAAEGEARANQALSNSITNNLLEWRRMGVLDKWNGVMPQMATGATPMVLIPKSGGGGQ